MGGDNMVWFDVKKSKSDDLGDEEIWDPTTVNEDLIGELVEVEEDVGQFNSKLYTILTDENEIRKVWGKKVLDDWMAGVNIHDRIRIVYLGKHPGKKGRADWTDWKVQTDKPPEPDDEGEGSDSSSSSSDGGGVEVSPEDFTGDRKEAYLLIDDITETMLGNRVEPTPELIIAELAKMYPDEIGSDVFNHAIDFVKKKA
jgi:hypothetical protein